MLEENVEENVQEMVVGSVSGLEGLTPAETVACGVKITVNEACVGSWWKRRGADAAYVQPSERSARGERVESEGEEPPRRDGSMQGEVKTPLTWSGRPMSQ